VTDILLKIVAIVVALILVVFSAKKWGQASAKKEQAEDNVEQMEKYEKIDSLPSVDDPFDRMRNK
jgi:hypothetical protein